LAEIVVVKGERSSLDGFWWDASLLVGDTAKSSHADASSERETMGMRREGRGWCTVIGVRIVTSGVDNGEGEDDVESEAEDAMTFLETEVDVSQAPAAAANAPPAQATVARENEVRSELTDAIRSLARKNPERSHTIRVSGKGDISKRIPNAARFKKVHVHLHHAKPKKFDNRRLDAMVQRLQKQHKQASTKIAEILYRLKKCAGKKNLFTIYQRGNVTVEKGLD